MRASATCLLVAATACRVSGVHFTGDDATGGGDDGAGSGSSAIHAYLLDGTTGVWSLARDSSNGFMVTSDHVALPDARSSAIDVQRHQLYVVHVTDLGNMLSSIARYSIESDGALTYLDDTQLDETNKFCIGRRIVMSPDRNWLAVGCDDSFVVAVEVYPDGRLGTVRVSETPGLVSPRAPAFSPSSGCVYFVDDSAAAGNIFAFVLSSSVGLSDAAASPYFGPTKPRAIATTAAGEVLIAGHAVYRFTPKQNCSLQPGGTAPLTEDETSIALAAQGRIYTAGHQLWGFDAALAPIPNYPAQSLGGSETYASAAIDPSTNDLYLTAPASGGYVRVRFDAQGGVMAATMVASPNTPNPVWLQLGP